MEIEAESFTSLIDVLSYDEDDMRVQKTWMILTTHFYSEKHLIYQNCSVCVPSCYPSAMICS